MAVHEKQQQMKKGSQRELFLWKMRKLQFCLEEPAFSTKVPPITASSLSSFKNLTILNTIKQWKTVEALRGLLDNSSKVRDVLG